MLTCEESVPKILKKDHQGQIAINNRRNRSTTERQTQFEGRTVVRSMTNDVLKVARMLSPLPMSGSSESVAKPHRKTRRVPAVGHEPSVIIPWNHFLLLYYACYALRA